MKVSNNFNNEVPNGLLDVWKKDYKLIKIVNNIEKIAFFILLKIKIYSFGIKNKIKNLFQQPVNSKIYYNNLREIINKGRAQLELKQEGSSANILHKERQLKQERSTDQENILEDIPQFLQKFETIYFRLKKFS